MYPNRTTAPTEPVVSGRRRWFALAVLAAGLSMIVIDGTIVGVALPVIIDDLGLDLTDAQWVNGVYAVVFAALLLTTGRVGDRLGRRRLFVVGVVVFLGGSLLAAAATDAGSLIGARIVQGLGAAFVLPATLSTVNATFRGRDRVVAFAIWGSVISGMAAVGPLLGGWLTTAFSWPWIFLVNIPLGLAVIVGAVLTVPETRSGVTAPGLDVDGFLLSALGFGAVVFALIEGQSYGWWRPLADLHLLGMTWPATAPISAVPVIGAVGVVALVLFVVWERHRGGNGRSAILDVRLFEIATFRWGNLAALTVAIGEFGLLFVLPLFLVNVLGLSTLGAGFVLAAMAAGAFAAGGAARHLAERFGAVNVVVLGLALETAGIIVTALVVDPRVSPWLLAPLLAVYGAGLGLASAQLTGTVLADIPVESSGQGSATQSTVRQLGAALGTAILGMVLSLGLAQDLSRQIETVAGVAPATAAQVVSATRDSAGAAIDMVRSSDALGPSASAAAQALATGFAQSTRTTMLVAAGFLLLGVAAALRLRATTHPHRKGNP